MRLVMLLLSLPWWADLAILAVLVGFIIWAMYYFSYKFERIVDEAVRDLGASFKDAAVTVHAVTAVPAPSGKSPYDVDEHDENFMEGVDDEPWDDGETNFYTIDATITPADPDAAWDPTGLALFPADDPTRGPTEVSHQLCPLYSAELFMDGHFRPAPEAEICGPRRVRLLFAVHPGLRVVQFARFVTCFGRLELPPPLPKGPAARGHASRT
jgi:hypothetical protein